MDQPFWYDLDPTPVDFPSESSISARAFELFFRERATPRPFAEYRRLAETELLERAFDVMLQRTSRRRRFPPKR